MYIILFFDMCILCISEFFNFLEMHINARSSNDKITWFLFVFIKHSFPLSFSSFFILTRYLLNNLQFFRMHVYFCLDISTSTYAICRNNFRFVYRRNTLRLMHLEYAEGW